ncbi:hypothetical protein CQZ94_30355 [Bacillus sp. MYb209]|nr:hypothetical protein CQZ94_30355 [Bacillus sp. MYb209]
MRLIVPPYPEIIIAKTIGCSRFVYNQFLALWNDTYKEAGKGLFK